MRGVVVIIALASGLAPAACERQRDAASHDSAPSQCVVCHEPEYESAPHHAAEKPTTCEVCHGSLAWSPTGLFHKWPLVGAHEKGKCFDCHMGEPPVFGGTPKACAGCHQTEFDGAEGHPGHFPTTCNDCHTTEAWYRLVAQPKWPAGPDLGSGASRRR